MKYTSTLLLVLLIGTQSFGQSLSFKYDKSGNRTSRTYSSTKSTLAVSPDTSFQINPSEKEDISDGETLGNFSVLVFPNPVSGELKIEISNIENEVKGSLSLFDQNGRLVLIQDKISESNYIDLSNLSSGNYFLIIAVKNYKGKWTIVKE